MKYMATMGPATFEQLWLPQRPLASDDLNAGVYRVSRSKALRLRYIETNPRALSNLLVVDVDHPDAVLRALWNRPEWLPNAVVENPVNGHAHAVWALREPVTRTEYAHRKPLAYAAAITEGLRRSVDGDVGYSGLLTKNPGHADWAPYWVTDRLYSLHELAGHLEAEEFMPTKSWARKRRQSPMGLGRNCALFETARTWAYREIRKHWGNSEGLHAAISAEVCQRNADYSEPLPDSEAQAIAESIHRWIVTESRMWADGPVVYEASFIAIQSARGRKGGGRSGEVRAATAAGQWEKLP